MIETMTTTTPSNNGHTLELYDLRASCHMTPYQHLLEDYSPTTDKLINATNQQSFHAVSTGNLHITVPNGKSTTPIMLKNVLYTPEIATTLVSIRCIDNAGYLTTFGGGICSIHNADNKHIGQVPMQNRLYHVDQQNDTHHFAHMASNGLTIMQFHSRMGHIAPEATRCLVKDQLVTGIQLDESSEVLTCDACTYAKMTCASVLTTQENPRANMYGDEVHSDVWGPSPVKTLGRKCYYVTFTDDHSCETHLELLSNKSDIFDTYKVYEAKLKTQKWVNIKAL